MERELDIFTRFPRPNRIIKNLWEALEHGTFEIYIQMVAVSKFITDVKFKKANWYAYKVRQKMEELLAVKASGAERIHKLKLVNGLFETMVTFFVAPTMSDISNIYYDLIRVQQCTKVPQKLKNFYYFLDDPTTKWFWIDLEEAIWKSNR